jgi:hypothetical protein
MVRPRLVATCYKNHWVVGVAVYIISIFVMVDVRLGSMDSVRSVVLDSNRSLHLFCAR